MFLLSNCTDMSRRQTFIRPLVTETIEQSNSPRCKRALHVRPLSIYLLKPAFQGVLGPLVWRIAKLGIRANQTTIFGCALSVAFGIALVWCWPSRTLLLLFPIVLVVRMALNAIDGMLARQFDQKSDLGAYLNELGDVVSDIFLYSPFAYLAGVDARWMLAAILLGVLSEMVGVMAPMVGASRRYDGPMGKSDRAVVFGSLATWLGIGTSLAPWALYWLPRLLCLLLMVTVFNRVRNGLAEKENGHG